MQNLPTQMQTPIAFHNVSIHKKAFTAGDDGNNKLAGRFLRTFGRFSIIFALNGLVITWLLMKLTEFEHWCTIISLEHARKINTPTTFFDFRFSILLVGWLVDWPTGQNVSTKHSERHTNMSLPTFPSSAAHLDTLTMHYCIHRPMTANRDMNTYRWLVILNCV